MHKLDVLRSLHTESEIHVRNFRTLKNKYDLTLCQSRFHTASETFVSHKKKFGTGSIFCVFRIRGTHFERCFDNSEPPYKRTPKSRMPSDKLSSSSTVWQTKCRIQRQIVPVAKHQTEPLTSWSILWIARDNHAAPWWGGTLLSLYAVSGLDGPNISSFFFSF